MLKKVNGLALLLLILFCLTSCTKIEQPIIIETELLNTIRNILDIPNISIDDILEVRIEDGASGVAPGTLNYITYSESEEDKASMLSLLDKLVYEDKTENWQIDGGTYKVYSIITTNQRYNISISNEYIYNNQKHYKVLGSHISFKNPNKEVYSFITYLDNATLYSLSKDTNERCEVICNIDNVGNLEFIEYELNKDNIATFELETEFGSLYIYDNDIFSYNGNFYKMTNYSFNL